MEYTTETKYIQKDGNVEGTNTRKCIYEGKLVEWYYITNEGYYIRDLFGKHIAIAQENELQGMEKVVEKPKVIISSDSVNFKYDPIGTLYVDDIGWAVVSIGYSDDCTIMEGIRVCYIERVRYESDDVKYASYE